MGYPREPRTDRPGDRTAAQRRLDLLASELAVAGDPDDGSVVGPGESGTPDPAAGRHRATASAGRTGPAGIRPEGRRVTGQHVTVVALLVAVLVSGGAWWVLSGRPEQRAVGPVMAPAAPVDPPAAAGEAFGAPVPGPGEAPGPTSPVPSMTPPSGAPPAVGAPAGSIPGPSSATVQASTVVVDVVGRVRRPGLVVLPAGSRVADALKSAGGVRPGVDRVALNLARPLVDGEQILVGVRALPLPAPAPGVVPAPTPGAPTAGSTTGSTTGSAVPGALVNLNTATLEQLDTLPGIDPVTGQAILDWRAANGAFTSADELLEVDGIGDATLADLRDLVTV